MYIKALEGRASKNNMAIFEALAFDNSLIKYEIGKIVKDVSWATISRRVDNLKDRGYIMETGKRQVTVAKRNEDTSEYGLTWKGFVASLRSDKVMKNIVEVLDKNPQIEPLNKIWTLIKGVYTDDEMKFIIQHFYEIFELMTIDLETTNELGFFFSFASALTRTDFEFPEGLIDKLGDSPKFLEWFHEKITRQEKETLKGLKQIREMKTEIERLLKREA